MPNIASIRNVELNSKRKYTQYCEYSNVSRNSELVSTERFIKNNNYLFMMKSKFLIYGILVLTTIAVVLISGCVQQSEQQDKQDQTSVGKETPQNLKGFSLSPKSFQSSDFTDFFEKAKQGGNIVSWAGDWNELSNTEKGGPTVVTSLASAYSYTPIIEVQFFTQSTGQLLRPLDETTKQSYKNSAVAFAEKYKPKYMGFGIEVNILYEKSPQDFENFVSFYSEVYDAVKSKSPNTKIFTVFQLEKMKGLSGGLFGGTNDPNNAQWSLLESFPKSDIVAFTTYPGLIYKNPSEIQQDYYAEIKSHTTKPLAFTEIGWHSEASPSGWESSEKEQAEFVATFFELTTSLDKEFFIWSFMYDQNVIEPFKSMGLKSQDGKVKEAWDKWIE